MPVFCLTQTLFTLQLNAATLLTDWYIPPALLGMLDMLMASAKILAVEAGTSSHLVSLPYQPACLNSAR